MIRPDPLIPDPTDTAGLARALREASSIWRATKARGRADERARPSVLLPEGRVHVVGDLTMAIADELAFLDDAGFRLAHIYHDYSEDRIVWIGPRDRFVEVGVSSGWVVMLGSTIDGEVPPFSPSTHTHAREIVPAASAATLPTIELEAGETDVRTRLPACAAWVRAALDALDRTGSPGDRGR